MLSVAFSGIIWVRVGDEEDRVGAVQRPEALIERPDMTALTYD
jgi:hypothetical protein